MSTSYSWEGKGRYDSFRLWMNMWGAGKTVKSLENTCHTWARLWWWFTEEVSYQVYASYLTLPHLSRSLKVTGTDMDQLVTYDSVPISYHHQDKKNDNCNIFPPPCI